MRKRSILENDFYVDFSANFQKFIQIEFQKDNINIFHNFFTYLKNCWIIMPKIFQYEEITMKIWKKTSENGGGKNNHAIFHDSLAMIMLYLLMTMLWSYFTVWSSCLTMASNMGHACPMYGEKKTKSMV